MGKIFLDIFNYLIYVHDNMYIKSVYDSKRINFLKILIKFIYLKLANFKRYLLIRVKDFLMVLKNSSNKIQ